MTGTVVRCSSDMGTCMIFLCGILLIAELSFTPCLGEKNDQCLVGILAEQCTASLRTLEEKFTKLQRSFDNQEVEIQQLKTTVEEQGLDLNKKATELQQLRDDLKGNVSDFTTNFNNHVSDFEKLGHSVVVLNSTTNRHSEDLQQLQDGLNDTNTASSLLRSDFNNHISDFEQLQNAVSKQNSTVNQHTTDLQTTNTTLNNQGEDIQQLRTDFNTSVTTLTTDLNSHIDDFQELNTAVNKQNSTVNQHTTDLQELHQDVVEVRNDISSVNASTQLTEVKLSPFLDPLQTQITNLNITVEDLNEELPLGHVYGNGSLAPGNGTATHWETTTGLEFSPVLKGGVTFDGISFTVPKTGIYYIYGQLKYEPSTTTTTCGFTINNGQSTTYLATSTNIDPSDITSQYSSQVRMLPAAEVVQVQMSTIKCDYNFASETALFGFFLLL